MSTKFQDVWLQDPAFADWVKRVDNKPYEARCTACLSMIQLGNMGVGALKIHSKGKKHSSIIQNRKASTFVSIQCFAAKPGEAPPLSAATTSMNIPVLNPSPVVTAPAGNISVDITPRGMKEFLFKENVAKAEILTCFQYVMNGLSMRETANIVQMDHIKYPDSEIAKKVSLGRDKISYSVNYGLAPHFKKNLHDCTISCKHIVVSFDECYNIVVKKQQMDLAIIFWDPHQNMVSTRYLNSVFLGKSAASDLVRSFKDGVHPISLKKILQVSMDGPSVNHKMLRDLQVDIRTNANDPYFLNIGSCGLHTLNNAFKTAFEKSGWDISSFLSSIYYVFHKSPARVALYESYTKSDVLPQKFCKIRWLENFPAAQRAIDILPNLKAFVAGVQKDKKVPKSNSYKRMATMLTDDLLVLKLTFFGFVAKEVEPFLTKFQKSVPLVPFLFSELNSVLASCIERVVKKEVFTKHETNVSGIDLSKKDNLMFAKDIDIGLPVKAAHRKLTEEKKKKKEIIKDVDVLVFREEAKTILVNFCSLLLEKSPLKCKLVKYVTCLDPAIAINVTTSFDNFKCLVETLEENNLILAHNGERAKKEYRELFSCPIIRSKCATFNWREDRLDLFYNDIFALKKDKFPHFEEIVKMVLILSHGNAFVERGFSVNKELLQINLQGESLIARRAIYDSVASEGGLDKIVIGKSLIHSYKNSHARFIEAKGKRKAETDEKESEAKRRAQTNSEIKALEKQRENLKADAKKQESVLSEKIKQLKADII